MLIYGAGGHAKVVASILLASGVQVTGIFDDNWRHATLRGYDFLCDYNAGYFPAQPLVIAIGNNHDRRKVAEKISHSLGQAIHPSAMIDATTRVGPGIVIVHNAVIQADCRVGNHVIVNTAAIIDHDCIVGDFAHIGPGATLCGDVCVGECTLVGAGSVVLPGISIGKECVIGAGSIVVSDVPDYAKVAGNPARIIY
ncbi:sugar O-acyltransferase, sialic acid O-acetyltransferase NeuD family [Dyadobacter sp. SG02]|uniref:acetyltransferase n=1 Tax=Dyadobacter sp. SG02 TaxID=1855291 RepID=UPI0008D03E7F|nr:acetyltransferase [Dyadobacter sp. SG02]SEJ69325.1 sugar O-acyltransferase, sialic acid O-acetyltransferase NeuD family [Dyadobacter sp. SG02]